MKYFLLGAITASAITYSIATVVPAVAQTTTPQPSLAPNPQIEIAYVKPANPALTSIYAALQQRKVLETLQLFLAPLKLPPDRKLVVKFDQCGGTTGIPYKQRGPVTICYEYVAQIQQLAPKTAVTLVQGSVTPETAIVGPVVQAVLQQVAIGVFDSLSLPVWGRVDDAADRLSAFVMLQFGPDIAWNTIVGTAWFMSGNATAAPDLSSVAGAVAQRYYTTLCIAYGGEVRGAKVTAAGADFRNFVQSAQNSAAGDLPQSRAQSCPDEYDTIKQAFDSLILPYVDRMLLQKVQATKWVSFGG